MKFKYRNFLTITFYHFRHEVAFSCTLTQRQKKKEDIVTCSNQLTRKKRGRKSYLVTKMNKPEIGHNSKSNGQEITINFNIYHCGFWYKNQKQNIKSAKA
ncbi:hypothetical protein BpHYR1_050871 [Brachionus plicatilis]|uniref:Uncharacterized protein n=1 Tax=Brachionus plicatilis TaxID=10195 RepID=A0A3M7PTT4_BRAPC|nr:hypothetical protein BpHYR1_050871 [Brachionus plicatilis]